MSSPPAAGTSVRSASATRTRDGERLPRKAVPGGAALEIPAWPDAPGDPLPDTAELRPEDTEPPLDAVSVTRGAEVAFYEEVGDMVTDRSNRKAKRKVRQRYVYVARKGAWKPDYGHGCGSDLEIERQNWHGTKKVGTIPLSLAPDWSPNSEHTEASEPTTRGGSWRLRFHMVTGREYAHKVAAYCFHRASVPPGVEWAEFKDEYEGDHLPFTEDGRVATRPEWVVCGWIQAVTKPQHNHRSLQLGAARRLEAEATRLARVAAEPNPPPGLVELIEQARAHKRVWSTLLGDFDSEADVRLDELDRPDPNTLEPSEIGIGLRRDYRSFAVQSLRNPYTQLVIRRQPPGREAHRELVAYCSCVALQQAGIRVPGVPEVLQRC